MGDGVTGAESDISMVFDMERYAGEIVRVMVDVATWRSVRVGSIVLVRSVLDGVGVGGGVTVTVFVDDTLAVIVSYVSVRFMVTVPVMVKVGSALSVTVGDSDRLGDGVRVGVLDGVSKSVKVGVLDGFFDRDLDADRDSVTVSVPVRRPSVGETLSV